MNLLAVRVVPLFLAAVSLATLGGCAGSAGVSGGPRAMAPVGDPVDNAVVPDPDNSGPHQFPLTINTRRNFYPKSARIIGSDGQHVTILVTGTSGKSGPDKSKDILAGNSGPHQGH